MTRYRWLALFLVFALVAVSSPARAQQTKPDDPLAPAWRAPSAVDWTAIPLQARLKIDPRLVKQFLDANAANASPRPDRATMLTFLVYLRTTAPAEDLDSMPPTLGRREALVERLQETAARTQGGIRAYLERRLRESRVARYESFWIFNGLVVQGDLETAVQLASRPEVQAIRPNRIHSLPQPVASADAVAPAWGLTKIGADRVWQDLGITGEGVVVASLDSGVDWTHPALQSKYRGYNPANPAASDHNYNWFDPTGTYPTEPGPRATQYTTPAKHGTHTMGTIVGSADGASPIGVAPGAKWIAAKVFDDAGESTDEWIHRAFQWCLAPTSLDGLRPDPARAPDIVSNSWGDDNGRDQTFAQDIRALRRAGIVTVFSAGNNGSGSETIGSPASLSEAFAVGATNQSDLIASFSGRGPSPWGKLKPEVVAPGVGILSSVPGGAYESAWSGTSMAAPHVAGLAALILQAQRQSAGQPGLLGELLPSASITTTEYLITSTAVDLGAPGPDNDYGYGRIDAYQAVDAVIQRGSLSGRVADSQSGQPIPGALVAARNMATYAQVTTQTAADGSYTLALAEGTYDVTASQFGYRDSVASGIQVLRNATTQLDLALVRLPSGVIRGRVTLQPGGQAAPAEIQILGAPLRPAVDAEGYYAATVPVGVYTVQAMPAEPGYRGSRVENVQVRADAVVQVDLPLAVAPRILVVDADAWVPESHIAYYTAALDNLLFSYHTWTIDDAYQHKPTAADLKPYGLVIWSQPHASPGYIEAWAALSEYLDGGGKLFISGEEIGYFDHATDEYLRYLGAAYVADDGGLGPISGIEGDILEGIELSYNTADSACNQTSPDIIAPGSDLGRALQQTRDGRLLALRGDGCAFRTVYLSYGLEGVGPAVRRDQVLERAISWMQQSRPSRAVHIWAPVREASVTIGGASEARASYDLAIANDGASPAAFDISIQSAWPARVLDALSGEPLSRTRTLPACGSQALRLEVSIPRSAYASEISTATVTAKAVGSASASDTETFRTRATSAWSWGPSLPAPRYNASAAVIDCAIYYVGGSGAGSENALSALEILEPGSATWRRGPNKPTPSAHSAAVALDGRMILIGGYDSARPIPAIDAVEIYDPARNAWSAVAPLPKALVGMAAAAYGGKVYAFGGSGSGGDSVQSYVYDPASDRWSTVAPLPASKAVFAQAVALGDYIYLAGGWPAVHDLWRYDPASDAWAALAPMNAGRHSFAFVASADGYLYAAGGGSADDALASVEQYDPARDVWSALPALQTAERAGAAGAYVDGRFYVLGGAASFPTRRVEILELDIPLSGSHLAVDAPHFQWDDLLAYEITLRNPAASARHVAWTHVLPPELTYVEGSASAGVQFIPQSRTLRWEGDIPASALSSFRFRARVGQGLPYGTMITSTVLLDAGTCSPRKLSAHTQLSMPLLHPQLTEKTVDKASAAPGDRLRYTVRMANASPFSIAAATLVDPIPEGVTLVPGSLQGGSYNAAQKRVEWSGALPPRPDAEPVFDWIDASQGQSIALGDDDCAGPLDLGFVFSFYGIPHSQVYISSNGMVLFGQCATAYANAPIPSPDGPNNLIAPLWDDLNPADGQIHLATFGSAPQRYAVISWREVSFYGRPDLKQTFQVVLHESTNRIVFQYLSLQGQEGAGSSATVGIENADGTAGVQHLYNGLPAGNALASGSAIEMAHSSTYIASFHVTSYDVLIDQPSPPRAIITNTAQLGDGLLTYQRTVTTSTGPYSILVPIVRR